VVVYYRYCVMIYKTTLFLSALSLVLIGGVAGYLRVQTETSRELESQLYELRQEMSSADTYILKLLREKQDKQK
jgi:hypothetical protein